MWYLLACTSPTTSPAHVDRDTVTDGSRDEVGGVDTPTPFDAPFGEVALRIPDTSLAGLATTHDADPPEVPATWEVDGEAFEVGLKLRGGATSFRTMDAKPSFTIDFAAFTEGATYRGARRLVLSNLIEDASLAGQAVSYALHTATGGVAPRQVHARVRVNDVDYGVYGVIEALDGRFVASRFDEDEDGPLYAAEGDLYRGHVTEFRLEDGEDDGHALLLQLVTDLDRATSDTRMRVLERHFDVDALLTTLAVDVLSGNPDAYVTRANHYALYREPSAERWTLIPTEAEQAFLAALPVHGSYIGRLRADCLDAPECADRLRARTLDVLGAWPELLAEASLTLDLLAPACASDPRAELDCAEGAGALTRFLEEREEAVRADLE